MSSRLVLWVRVLIAVALDKLRQWLSFLFQTPFAADTQINVAWFEGALRAQGELEPGTRLQSAVIQSFQHRGLSGTSVKQVLAKTTDGKELSFVLKRSTPTWAGRRLVITGGNWRQGEFYNNQWAQRLFARSGQQVIIPDQPFFASGSLLLGEYVLLMRDLFKLENANGLNKVLFDQVFDNRKREPADDVAALAVVERLFVAIASVHAEYWQSQEVLQQTWLRGADWHSGGGVESWTHTLNRTREMWQRAKTFKDVTMPARLQALIDRSLAASSWARFQQQMAEFPFTLCHGDFHASNMVAVGAGTQKQFYLLDWSEIGVDLGPGDIGQFIVSDIPHRLFKEHGERLLKAYWTALTQHRRSTSPATIDNYDFKTCREQFAIVAIQRWIFFVSLLCGWGANVPAKLRQYFIDQLDQFVELFGSFDATYPVSTMGYIE